MLQFALVASLEVVRVVVSLVVHSNWSMHQLDVKLAFLNGVSFEMVEKPRRRGVELAS